VGSCAPTLLSMYWWSSVAIASSWNGALLLKSNFVFVLWSPMRSHVWRSADNHVDVKRNDGTCISALLFLKLQVCPASTYYTLDIV